MPLSPPEISALPVLVPAVILALAAMVWVLSRRGAATLPRIAAGAVAVGYGAGLLSEVLLPFPLGTSEMPWQVWVQPIPLITADPAGLFLNVVLFLPMGVLLPIVTRAKSARRVLLVGLLLSLGIELTQLIADVTISQGRVADVDDLLANTLGALLGYAILRTALRIPALSRVVTAASWPQKLRVDGTAGNTRQGTLAQR